MTRRKLVGAALFFTLFGALALLPPLVLVSRFDARVLGVPVETLYVFAVWIVLVVGAWWFGRLLPHDEPARRDQGDRPEPEP